jgi:alpha-L-fucosidase 2
MMRMGLWCENFAIPVVLNECMLQSYTGTIRLFPNVLNLGAARFEKLRAVGAFLVSATFDGNTVTQFEVLSEKGVLLRFVSPWQQRSVQVLRSRDQKRMDVRRDGSLCSVPTDAGEHYSIRVA